MWRRAVSSQLQTLASWRRLAPGLHQSAAATTRSFTSVSTSSNTTSSPPPFSQTSGKKRIEDINPIATGHEREELEAELEGRNILEINSPVGPFGTKEEPAIIQSVYDKRVVGCSGVEDEDEHDVVWFWLEKGKTHECPVCSQYFKLEVVGPGGPPDGHGDDDHHH